MKLEKLVMNGFRSVKLMETLFVDDRVTILIGANDHGKSNLLAAIQCLNDDKRITPDDKNWDSAENAPVEINWHFSATEELLEKLRQLSPEPESPPVGEVIAPPLATAPQIQPQPTPLPPQLRPETFPIAGNREIIFSRDSLTNKVRVAALPLPVSVSHEDRVLALRPVVELFESPGGNVIDQVSLKDLETPQLEFMQGIFRLAGIWDQRAAIFTQNDTTSRILDEASAKLTLILNDRWNQGRELKWKLEHTGTNGDHIVIKIADPAIRGRYTRPSLRSSGFRTYFLLSMIIYARTENKPSNSYIYLFDEPGTYLHPSAQLDLQRSFETIADQAQIVYTTHSLFLVSKNYPERNRVISKTGQGTKIDQKPFSKNWKSVRESLGILLSNNFLIADKTLLVEGPSDIIYLLDAVKKLKRTGKLDIDLNDMSVVDAGDTQNFVAMSKLMLSEGREIVALLDGDKGGKSIEAQLRKFCVAEITTKKLQIHLLPDNKSTEDVFANIDALRSAVRAAYDQLIANGQRTPKEGLSLDEEIQKIAPSNTATLGKILDQTNSGWFKPPEKISKLLIAITYEDRMEHDPKPVPEESLVQLEKIRDLLNLRGEKSKQLGVFDEAQ